MKAHQRTLVPAPVGCLIVAALFLGVCSAGADAQQPGNNPGGEGDRERRSAFHGHRHLPRLAPSRRGWTDWWEIHRDRYLRPVLRLRQIPRLANRPGRANLPIETDPPDDLRDRAIETLLEATRADDSLIREAAALALGRIGAGSSADRLEELTDDPHPLVRRGAWLGLALLGTEDARAFLLQGHEDRNEPDLISWTMALGLLERPGPGVFKALKNGLNEQRSPGGQLAAMWALRAHEAPDLRSVSRAVLRRTDQPALAQSAMLGLGQSGDRRDLDMLQRWMIQADESSLPVVKRLKAVTFKDPLGNRRGLGGIPMTAQKDAVQDHMDYLRAAAARAFARVARRAFPHMSNAERDNVRVALRRSFRRMHDRYRPVHRVPTLLALGRLGEDEDTDFIEDVMAGLEHPEGIASVEVEIEGGAFPFNRTRQRSRKLDRQWDLVGWMRGYGALAAGIYMSRGTAGPFVGLRGRLRRDLQRDAYSTDYRAACALGLAFAAWPEDERIAGGGIQPTDADLKALRQAASQSLNDNPIVFGYAILALGLLGDEGILPAARRFFGGEADAIDTAGLRNRKPTKRYSTARTYSGRAVALGLAALGDQRAGSTLKAAWGRNFWLDLELARAMAWCGAYDAAEGMIELAADRPRRDLAVSAVWSLGELLDARRPSRIRRLVTGTNYQYYRGFGISRFIARPEPLYGADKLPHNRNAPVWRWHGLGNPFAYHTVFPTEYRSGSGEFHAPNPFKNPLRLELGPLLFFR